MASCGEYLNYISECLSLLDGIEYRSMMGEYIVYYKGKITAYICDDRFLVKPVPAAEALMPNAPREAPYAGAKEMLLVENTDDREFMKKLFESIYDELPASKSGSGKRKSSGKAGA